MEQESLELHAADDGIELEASCDDGIVYWDFIFRYIVVFLFELSF